MSCCGGARFRDPFKRNTAMRAKVIPSADIENKILRDKEGKMIRVNTPPSSSPIGAQTLRVRRKTI